MEPYQSNLLTLLSLDSALGALAAQSEPGERIRVFESKSGAATAEVTREDGAEILVHSRYDPADEAAAFARSAPLDKITTYIVLGFGLGYHIKALLAEARRESQIIVIEKDPALFRAALDSVDLRELFASRRVFPIVGKDIPEVFKALNPHVVKIFLDATYLVHRPSAQAAPEYYSEIHKAFGEFVTYGMQNVITTVSVDFLSKKNCLMNLPYYASSGGITRYQNAFAGHPAIIVSAGPSLHRNVEMLRRAQGKAVIIAVSTVFKPLLKLGIKPDFAVVLDYHPISKKYFEDAPGDRDVVLVVDPKASYEAVEAHRGPKTVIHNDALHEIIGSPAFHKGAIPAGTTVAHSAFYFAEYIGADPIIFTGQDLAHPDGITHFPGTAVHDIWAPELNRFQSIEMREWDAILRMRNSLRKVPDIHGNDIYTDGQMFSYLKQFEMNFHNSRAHIVDATEGGAAKKYTTVMTLAEALSRYAQDKLPEMPGESSTDRCADDGRGEITEALEARVTGMSEIRDFYDRTLAILNEINEIWPDQEKMAPLLAEINEIRREVLTHKEENKLVRDIAQAVELRKVQHDRKMRSDRLEGLDMQKAQLERDLEYVAGLRDAVDELEKMFRDALERFRGFDFEGRIERRRTGEAHR